MPESKFIFNLDGNALPDMIAKCEQYIAEPTNKKYLPFLNAQLSAFKILTEIINQKK